MISNKMDRIPSIRSNKLSNSIDKGKSFVFTKANLERYREYIARYPVGKQSSAVLALLDLAQRQNDGWLSIACIEYVADLLQMPYIKVYEVASFYTMFNLKPVGKYHIQICGTTPCWLRGADKIIEAYQKKLKIKLGQTTSDRVFTLSEVECLGSCIHAPLVQINDDYIENLTEDKIIQMIDDLKRDKNIKSTDKK